MRHTHTHSTVHVKEADYFSTQYRDWWDPNGSLAMLHRMNDVRVPLFRNCFTVSGTNTTKPLKYKTVLDIGCGAGILSEELARLGATVTGIDPSLDVIKIAEEHAKCNTEIANFRPKYYSTTIEEHGEQFKNHYDGIVASEIIEHVTDKDLFIKACVQALKPGGKILFTAPNRTWWSQFVIIFFMQHVIRAIPKGTHEYERFITPKELTALLEKYNCKIQLSTGLSYNTIMKKWKITDSQKLVFALQAIKLK